MAHEPPASGHLRMSLLLVGMYAFVPAMVSARGPDRPLTSVVQPVTRGSAQERKVPAWKSVTYSREPLTAKPLGCARLGTLMSTQVNRAGGEVAPGDEPI